jgi:hypothetical protein
VLLRELRHTSPDRIWDKRQMRRPSKRLQEPAERVLRPAWMEKAKRLRIGKGCHVHRNWRILAPVAHHSELHAGAGAKGR